MVKTNKFGMVCVPSINLGKGKSILYGHTVLLFNDPLVEGLHIGVPDGHKHKLPFGLDELYIPTS